MKKLFFELLQVATGKLECVERGPSPEEWQKFYDLSKQQGIEGISYRGVERLFEFGLRAPQDISIDWMSEAEMIREQNEQVQKLPRMTQFYPEELQMLRKPGYDGQTANGVLTLQQVFQIYLQHRLNMQVLMDYCYVLRKTEGRYETIKGHGVASILLGAVGVRRFAGGLMWLLQQMMGLEREHMLWKPKEDEGRFLMGEVFGENSKMQRLTHGLWYLKLWM